MLENRLIDLPEPWLRVTHAELPVVIRAVVHALELAKEEVDRWCGDLTFEQMNARPSGLESVGFQLRHLARSLDRLLTYAEGNRLSEAQTALLRAESTDVGTREEILTEWNRAFRAAMQRLLALSRTNLDEPRGVGKKQLQTTLGGILVHVADHSQRHVGQMITTVKLVTRAR